MELEAQPDGEYEYVLRADLVGELLRVRYEPDTPWFSEPCNRHVTELRTCSNSLSDLEQAQLRCYYIPFDHLHVVR